MKKGKKLSKKTTIVVATEKRIARPLGVLAPLIRADIADGDRAGMEFYVKAGEKLIEAKESGQIKHGQFEKWAEKVCNRKQQTFSVWMRAARKRLAGESFRTLSESKGDFRPAGRASNWHKPVKHIAGDARKEVFNGEEDETKAEKQLATRLIDIGYKVLSVELHPDKGGSRQAMTRLNVVRDNLKGCVDEW
jgi:hypothetical protein